MTWRAMSARPSTAAAAVTGVLWVGPLTPADRTARAWDAILPALAAALALHANATNGSSWGDGAEGGAALLLAAGVAVDGAGRAVVQVVLPPLSPAVAAAAAAGGEVVHAGAGALEGVPPALAEALAAEFAGGVSAAGGDPGAWAAPVVFEGETGGVKKVMVGVSPAGLAAAVRWLAAHRAAQWVAPRLRRVAHNNAARGVLQGEFLPGISSSTPFWDAGVTGTGQVIGAGDTGADRRNCYLGGDDKFAMYRSIVDGDAVDDDGHGTHVCGSLAGLTLPVSYCIGARHVAHHIVHRCSPGHPPHPMTWPASVTWPCCAAGNGGDGSANGGAKDAQIAFTAWPVHSFPHCVLLVYQCTRAHSPHPPPAAYPFVPFSA